MKGKRDFDVFKHADLLELSIPIGIIIASVFLPLQPIVRQALIGVILVWLGVEAMTGFHIWK
jgi:hypothetical protein